MKHTIRFVAVCIAAVLTACAAQDEFPTHTHEEFSANTSLVAQTCTSLNTRGQPVKGNMCGGSTHAFNCTPGAMYSCNDKTTSGNCTLITACANGCIAADFAGDACFTGSPSFVVPTTTIPGGTEATATVNLAAAHTNDAIVNVRTIRGDLLAARFDCNIPHMPPPVSSATFNMPTGVVSAPTPVDVYTDISYVDPQGQSHELVARTVTVNLQPGGSPPPAPAVTSFTLTPSSVAAGAVSFVNATLNHMAPVNGQLVNITSSDPATASVITGGQPNILGGCTTGGGAETLQAARQVATTTNVTISAASAGSSQVPATNTLTVQAGCAPLTCVDLPMPYCQGSDGCGGTLQCGCSFGEVCGGGGPGICGAGTPPPTTGTPTLTGFTLSPSSTTAGSAVTGTVTLSAAAPTGGVVVALSSSSAAASVPPSVTVGAGFTSASFTITTGSVSTATTATITATLGSSQAATLSIAPAAVPAAGTLTLTATGRSGVTITSNPAGISVPVGTTGSGSFPAGTSITLTASSGRTAIWSGACTTARDTNTCTFTLSGNASVTANVQ